MFTPAVWVQAVAFAEAKKNSAILEDIAEVLQKPLDANNKSGEKQTPSCYMLLSREVLSAAGWLKRYSQALIKCRERGGKMRVMTVCCRNAIAGLDRGKCSNAGLLLSRYLRVPVNQQGDEHNKERKELFDIAAHALKNPEVIGAYRQAFHRRKRWIETSAAQTVSALFETKGRMIIGLGGENVLETGLTLEHTYGVPIIPGSALKGLAAHYCTQTWGEREKGFDVSIRGKKGKVAGEFAKILFGDKDESGFNIAFHDAWLTPESLKKQNFGLKQDVMTPHHGEYYSGNAAPTDFDDPNPVHFLSVTGQFSVAFLVKIRVKPV